MKNSKKCIGLKIIATIAILFGLLTLKSGGEVLFIDGAGRAAAGNYVPFVLWTNFLLGFAYIIAGIGIWLQKPWAVTLAIIIATITFILFIALGLHINGGGSFEPRTIKAMVLRLGVWTFIAIATYIRLIRHDYAIK